LWIRRIDASVSVFIRRFERDSRFPDVAKPSLGIALQAASQQPPHRVRCVGWQRRPVDLLPENRGNDVRGVFSGERAAARQHLEQDDAERPDVGALVHPSSSCLFWGHVGGGAEDDTERGRAVRECRRIERIQAGPRRRVERLGQAEVQNLDRSVLCDLHVRRLEIAVNDPLFVCRLECLGDLAGDADGIANRQGPAVRCDGPIEHQIRERRAFNQFHDERVNGARVVEAIDLRDMRMIECGEHLGFAAEPRESFGIAGHGGGKNFQCEVAQASYRVRDRPHPCRQRRWR
jgi:hypothetical protein